MTALARCKFRVGSVTDSIVRDDGTVVQQNVQLHCMYDENDPEDTKFAEDTPWGGMSFALSNPFLIGEFKTGDDFYVELIPAEDKS